MSGEAERDEAMARVAAHANPEWVRLFGEYCTHLNNTQDRWTTDEARALMEQNHPDVITHDYRCIGPVIRRMKEAGEIVPVGMTTSDRRPRNKAYLIVWSKPTPSGEILKLRALIDTLPRAQRYNDEELAKALAQRGVRVA